MYHRLLHLSSDKLTLCLLLVGLILIVLRFAILPISPPDIYVDESASIAHAEAMIEQQTNTQGKKWPLYSESLGGGFITPVYLYPLSAWGAAFGTSEVSMRAMSQFFTILAIILLALAMHKWFGKTWGLVTAVVALALPWGWLQGSLIWDPALVPLMAATAFLGWTLIQKGKRRNARITGLILLPAGLILLAYVYPPYWVSAPLLFAAAYSLLYAKRYINWRHLLVTGLLSVIAVLPLLGFITDQGTLNRSSSLSIFSDVPIFGALFIFLKNLLLLISPVFLFIIGDANLRHSTGLQGMLGIAALIPVMTLLVVVVNRWLKRKASFLSKQERYLSLVGFGGYMLSLVGSALTIEGQPHSLRSSAAWIFAVIIITISWRVLFRLRRRWLTVLAISVFIVATAFYAIDLAFFFPSRSTNFFISS